MKSKIEKLSIAIIEDHPLYRLGIKKTLSAKKGVEIWGEFENGLELIEAIEERKENPQMAFVDVNTPKMNGIEFCQWIKTNEVPILPIMLTMHDEEYFVQKCICSGAVSYLLKDSEAEEIHAAIDAVWSDGFYFNDILSKKTLIKLTHDKCIQPRFNYEAVLTKNEKEIVLLLCEEFSREEIAEQLGASKNMVKERKRSILRKIGATKATSIAIYAAKKGWV